MKKSLEIVLGAVLASSFLVGSNFSNNYTHINEPSSVYWPETGIALGINYKGNSEFRYYYSDYHQNYKPEWYKYYFAKGTEVSTWNWAFSNNNPNYSLIMSFNDDHGKYHWLVVVNDGYNSRWEEKRSWYNVRIYLSAATDKDIMPNVYDSLWMVSYQKSGDTASDWACHASINIADNHIYWGSTFMFSY